ncbi:hypothetical protein V8C86DRAFT_1187340 [Haematococcus lacustris]
MSKLVNMRRSTQLLDLPKELLSAVLRQLHDGDSRLQVFKTSKRLATALLQHTPSIQLTHPLAVDLVCSPGDERCIHPFLAHALLTRKAQLELTLQPEGKLVAHNKGLADKVLASTLGAVELCPAVTHLTVAYPEMQLPLLNWKPVYSSGLAASYPSLTSLTLDFLDLSTCQLGRLVSHPALLPLLKHLDISEASIVNKPQPASSPFTGSRLQQLSLGWGYWDFTPHLAPLAPHLTQLAVVSLESNDSGFSGSLSSLAAAVGTLTCLQSLEFGISGVEAGDRFSTLMVPVLASLPSLHTLLLIQKVEGCQQPAAGGSWRWRRWTGSQPPTSHCTASPTLSTWLYWVEWTQLGRRCWLQLSSTCVSAIRQGWRWKTCGWAGTALTC